MRKTSSSNFSNETELAAICPMHNVMSKIGSFIRPINDFLKKYHVISSVASMIPHPIAQTISGVASKLGYGGRKGRGLDSDSADMEGGSVMSRSDLLSRLGDM